MEKFDVTKMFRKIDVLDHGHVELFDAMILDPRLKVANAARVSYKKESKEYSEKDAKLVKFLFDHGHFSTYRHSYFSFRIKAPLFVFRNGGNIRWDPTGRVRKKLGTALLSTIPLGMSKV